MIDETLESVGELDAAALDSDEHQLVRAVSPFDDLGGHADQRSAERAIVQKGCPGGHRGGKVVGGLRWRNSCCASGNARRPRAV